MRFDDNLRVVEKDGKVRLTIRVSDRSADSWIISPKAFKAMGNGWQDTSGTTIKDGGTEIFIQSKQVDMPSGYVRISICQDTGPIREYRVLADDLRQLFADQ